MNPAQDPAQVLNQRLQSLSIDPPRTEHSFYGPLNSLLQRYFSEAQRWMIKPQAPLQRYIPAPGIPAIRDSYARRVRDSHHTMKPDFLVCRFGPTRTSDIANIVIEVKPDNGAAAVREGEAQLLRYMTTIINDLSAVRGGGELYGVLVSGTATRIWRVNAPGQVPWRIGQTSTVLGNGFNNFLVERINQPIPPIPHNAPPA